MNFEKYPPAYGTDDAVVAPKRLDFVDSCSVQEASCRHLRGQHGLRHTGKVKGTFSYVVSKQEESARWGTEESMRRGGRRDGRVKERRWCTSKKDGEGKRNGR